MATLAQLLASRTRKHPRLATVPPAVIEDVLAIALEEASRRLIGLTIDVELLSYDDMLTRCEGCENIGEIEKMHSSPEDCVFMCDACVEDMRATESPSAEPDPALCPICGGVRYVDDADKEHLPVDASTPKDRYLPCHLCNEAS